MDAGFNDLARPILYGGYHGISFLRGGSTLEGPAEPTIVAGPLCESGDVFTQDDGGIIAPRPLPSAEVGDLVVFHDAGAYASSMSSNYISRGLAPEVLVDGDRVQLIRRRQTVSDLVALEAL